MKFHFVNNSRERVHMPVMGAGACPVLVRSFFSDGLCAVPRSRKRLLPWRKSTLNSGLHAPRDCSRKSAGSSRLSRRHAEGRRPAQPSERRSVCRVMDSRGSRGRPLRRSREEESGPTDQGNSSSAQPRCGDGTVPASEAYQDQHSVRRTDRLRSRCAALWRRRGSPATIISSTPSTISVATATDPRHTGEWLDEVATRAAAQNEQYLELMETPDFRHAMGPCERAGLAR